MRKAAFIFISLLLACKGNQHQPANLISKEKMQKVLLDVNMAEAYSAQVKDSLHRPPGAKNTDSLISYYKEIFAHHKITPDEFSTSLYWYKGHPEDLDSIYASMLPVATAWQTKPPPVVTPANVPVEHKPNPLPDSAKGKK